MNKDPSDNLTELNPGDVIYLNKPPSLQSKDEKPKELDKPEEVESAKPPVQRRREPSFEIPLASDNNEKAKPKVAPPPVRRVTESFEIPLASRQPSSVQPKTVDPILPRKPEPSVLLKANTQPQISKPIVAASRDVLSNHSPIPQSPKLQKDTYEGALSSAATDVPKPLPPLPQTDINVSSGFQNPSVTPPLPPVVNNPLPQKQYGATTDLQGTLVMPENLNVSPTAVIPQPPAPTVTHHIPGASRTEDREDIGFERKKGTKNLKVFGVITILILLSTLVAGILFAWPKIQAFLDSRQPDSIHKFEDVLVNLLQVQNQEMEIEIIDSQLHNIAPVLDSQNTVSEGRIVVNNVLHIEYPKDSFDPTINAGFHFDLDLQTQDKRDNLVLDVGAVFTPDGQAYFKLESLSINDQPQKLEKTSFADRWSNLGELLHVQASGESNVLTENESVFLNYIANLLNTYSYPHYIVLLPAFNITQSQQYNQVKEAILQSRAYDLDTDSCKAARDTELQCNLEINYEELYSLYEDIHNILGEDLPAYYDILKVADDKSYNLPQTVVLVFDKNLNYPISLSVPDAAEEISASSLTINYENFDDPSFKLQTFSDPLDLREYHKQILEYEQEIDLDI